MKHSLKRVVNVAFHEGYSLMIGFEDGSTKVIDFQPVLKGPLFGPLNNPQVFRKVQVDPVAGTLVWPNGADFDPDTLYNWDQVVPELVTRLQTT